MTEAVFAQHLYNHTDIIYGQRDALHSDKISHLTSTLLTCLQIIKHNIAYMSAVGAEYADIYFAT